MADIASPGARRTLVYISDGTGITAETIGNSLIAQFEGVEFKHLRIPFVDSVERAEAALSRLAQIAAVDGRPPILINTVVDPRVSEVLARAQAPMVDVFGALLPPLEAELGLQRGRRVNKAHQANSKSYEARIEATNFALAHDDGSDLDYHDADLVLLGVSRSGKTPTCLYMALQYGVKAANFPLLPEDLESGELPKRLRTHRAKLFGLSIEPDRLCQIREERRPGSKYASPAQVRSEVKLAEALYRNHRIPWLNTTYSSVEEIASKVMQSLGLERHLG